VNSNGAPSLPADNPVDLKSEDNMNKLIKPVLQGLAAVLPLGLTAYLIYWLFATAETYTRTLLLWVIPEASYFPGLGIMAALVILFLAGLLVNAYGIRYLVQLSDRLFNRIPLIKSVYGAIQDITRIFSLTEKKELQSVVSFDAGNGIELIGFITGEHAGKKLFSENAPKVGVYLPMSYQIGGFTVYVERDKLKPLDIGVEEAMRLALTGGATGEKT
jgi:uncharacterized membrane protein